MFSEDTERKIKNREPIHEEDLFNFIAGGGDFGGIDTVTVIFPDGSTKKVSVSISR